MTRTLEHAMAATAEAVSARIASLLPDSDLPEARLHEAMRHGTLGGGKRMRPLLVMESAHLFAVGREHAERVAAAVELVHCYSLIHDDLPAMDDSDLRRGRPTVHKAFDEATAVLTGDGLLTLAFEVLSEPETHEDPAVRIRLVHALARAAGPHGMVGGQMLDLIGETERFDMTAITRLQRMKTGEMIAFSTEAGAILGKASRPQHQALAAYAHDLGLAFQIADDLLDLEGDEARMGKAGGQDAERGKATFVAILGPERAREQAGILSEQARQHLDIFDDRADILRAVAKFAIERKS